MVMFCRAFPVRCILRGSFSAWSHLPKSCKVGSASSFLIPTAVNSTSMSLHTLSSGNTALLKKISSCIAQEDSLADLESILASAPQPFILQAVIDNVVTMTLRTMSMQCPIIQSHRQLEVRFSLPSSPMKVDTVESELEIPFQVWLSQAESSTTLVASCVVRKDGAYDINTIQFLSNTPSPLPSSEPATIADALHSTFTGPELEILSERTQDRIVEMLQSLGVTPELCRYMQHFVKAVKEPTEYRLWLKGFQKCVSGD